MKQKIMNMILEVLKEKNELEAISISEELEKKEYELTYDTISKYLKQMTAEGKLKREAKGSLYSNGRKHWNYYYSLKNQIK